MKTTDTLARQQLSRLAERLLANIGGEADTTHLKEMVTALAGNSPLRHNIALLVRDFCADHIRPEIKKFAGLMEMKLMKHDPGRGGMSWKNDAGPQQYLDGLDKILVELKEAVGKKRGIGLKAADLANYAMMLADLAGDLEDV